MATPRVFVSSTYYDLKHIRNDIYVFLKGLGFEPIMHDKGSVTYTQDVSLETSCYNELDSCEIVICIIGNQFGTKSSSSDYSITMSELKNAINSRKRIYIYILKEVYDENFTYQANKDKEFIPYHANDIKIHEFIYELKSTVKDHPIKSFESISDITDDLKSQFAGLFQHLLNKDATLTETKTYEDLQYSANEIKSLISEFSIERDDFLKKLDGTIYATRPTVRYILQLLKVHQYQIIADSRDAIFEYLSSIGFVLTEPELPGDNFEFIKTEQNKKYILTLSNTLFDENGNILDIRKSVILEQKISLTEHPYQFGFNDDELPF